MHARIGLAAQVVVGLQQDLKKARQIFFAKLRRGALQRGPLVGRCGNQLGIRAANACDEEISHVANGFAAKVLQIAPFFLKGVHQAERAIRRTRGNRADQFLKRVFRDHAEQFADFLVPNRIPAKRARLFQQGKSVAQAALGHARDHRERARFHVQIFFGCNFLQAPADLRKGQRAKVKML